MNNTTNKPITQYYQSIKKCRIKNLIFDYFALICLFVYLFICLFPSIASASTTSNDNYNVEINDLDTAPEKIFPTPNISKITPVIKKAQTPIAGIKYLSQSLPLSFSISQELIDFGIIVAGSPVVRSFTFSIPQNSIGYQILAFENHSLRLPAGSEGNAEIADVTCDNGACSETTEAIWSNNLTFGFGFRCENITGSICANFGAEQYRQFANLDKSEQPQSIASGGDKLQGKSEINLKVNTQGTQKPGGYSNTITLIAIPNF